MRRKCNQQFPNRRHRRWPSRRLSSAVFVCHRCESEHEQKSIHDAKSLLGSVTPGSPHHGLPPSDNLAHLAQGDLPIFLQPPKPHSRTECAVGCISMRSLPRTFRDAVVATRKLSIRYLWIDSLCIIQDDENDCQRESSYMVSIFQNEYLTLAATASSDNSGGCFRADPSLHTTLNSKHGTSYARVDATISWSLIAHH